jgi:hypothetical protein
MLGIYTQFLVMEDLGTSIKKAEFLEEKMKKRCRKN